MTMQGYDPEKALSAIIGSMRKDGIRMDDRNLETFIHRAEEAHFAYMQHCGILDAEGWASDEGEYDEDDAFEEMLESLTAGMTDDAMVDQMAQLLDSFQRAQLDYFDENGFSSDD